MSHTYLIALGSNMWHPADGPPRNVLQAAVEVLEDVGLLFQAVSPIIETPAMGRSRRRFANAAAVVETMREPPVLLGVLKAIELAFGRRARGAPWGARVLDLDIVLWDGGIWTERGLAIPHPEFRQRDFVLGPASAIAPQWRDPVTGLSLAQLHARLTKPRRAPR